MKNRFKMVSLVLILVLVFTGCSATPTKKDAGDSNSNSGSQLKWDANLEELKGEEITLLWVNTDGKNGPRSQLLKKFTKETGIKVNQLAVSYNSLYNKITTAALANSSEIDLVEMDTIWAGQFYEGNLVVDLTNTVPDDFKKKFTNSSITSVTYKDHLVAMPFFTSTKHFYWNEKLLKEAGYSEPPKTWTEFREMSKKLTKNGVYASAWSWKQAESLICDYVALLYAFGGDFFDDSGQPVFNKGGGLEALKFMVNILRKDKTVAPGSLQWTESDVSNAFAAGKIAMMLNWEGQYPKLNDPSQSSVVNQTDVGLIPGQGDVVSSTVTGSEGIAIMQNSKHKQAALVFLKWMASKDFQLPLFKNDGHYPSLKTLYDDPEIKKADKTNKLKEYSKQFKYGHNRPNAPGYVKWSDILSAEIHDALEGKKSPKEALDRAAEQISKAIEKAK